MDIRPLSAAASLPSPAAHPSLGQASTPRLPDALEPKSIAGDEGDPDKLQQAFTDFVGQTLFGSMLASMRKTVGKPAYLHGGRTEEVFQQQLDQITVEQLTEASAKEIAEPMFDLFQMQRRA
jgi:flagellar protein FlgJ